MGSMRFLVTDRERLSADAAQRAALFGMDDIPVPSDVAWEDDLLVVSITDLQSGALHVPLLVEGHGELMLATASLMQRERPYLLEIELARGIINRIRNQVAAWQGMGLVVPRPIASRLTSLERQFAQAATRQHEPPEAAPLASDAIREACDLTIALGESYTEQALAVRRRHSPTLNSLLGIRLGNTVPREEDSQQLAATFNTAGVSFAWPTIEPQEGVRDWTLSEAQIEWSERHDLRICGGPLLVLDDSGVPDWLSEWKNDFDTLLSFLIDHVRTVVNRYRNQVHLWMVTARTNVGRLFDLDDDQLTRMIVRSIEVTRELDPRAPIVVAIDQPWAEYAARSEAAASPLQIADALVRAGLGVAGMAMEVNAGYLPHGTAHRTLLEYSRQLDRWSLLGMPLLVLVSAPSAAAQGRSADQPSVLPAGPTGELSPRSQADWVRRYVPLMLAKNCVQAIFWNQLQDEPDDRFPHGGLFDADGNAKLALGELRTIRERYLAP